MPCTKISVGRGDTAKFWTSRWLEGAAPADLAPNLFKLTRLKRLTVDQGMASDRWMVGMQRITSEVQLREYTALWIKLQGVILSEGEDQTIWKPEASHEYSLASAYMMQFYGSFSAIDFSKLWRSKFQPKCKFFMLLYGLDGVF